MLLKTEISISRFEMLVREIAMLLIVSICCLAIGFGAGLFVCKDRFQDGCNFAIKELFIEKNK